MPAAAMRRGRATLIGAGSGAAVGALFALAVISLADCAGPNCAYERVIGVGGHAAGGAILGALLGLAVAGAARLLKGGG